MLNRVIALFAFLCGLVVVAPAFAKAPVLKSGKGQAIVIVEVDGINAMPGEWSGTPDMNLHMSWFDTKQSKPYLESEFQGLTTTERTFRHVSTKTGRSYLISDANAGRSAFFKFSAQYNWQLCLNKGTVNFYVPEDTYLYLGLFNPGETRAQLERAVRDGRMPGSMQRAANLPPLLDSYLAGFRAPSGTAEEALRIKADMAEIYGMPIDVTIADKITPTEFELSDYKGKNGETAKMCFEWSSKKKRPADFNGFKE